MGWRGLIADATAVNAACDAQSDGGQLALYNATHSTSTSTSTTSSSSSAAGAGFQAGEPALVVSPLGGRLLVFDSRLPHEVLPAHRTRLSITAFFYKGAAQASLQNTAEGASGTGPQGNSPCSRETTAAGKAALAAPGPGLQRVLLQGPERSLAHHAATGSYTTSPCATPAANGQQAATGDCGAAGTADLLARHCSISSNNPTTTTAPTSSGNGSSSGSMPRIFVSIAAFRDEECQWTLRDLFLQAACPDRVSVGVVWQIDPEADAYFVRLAGASRTAAFAKQVCCALGCRFGEASLQGGGGGK